jgi:hypothetical protein
MLTFSFTNDALSQDKEPYVRIAKLVIDSSQLEAIKLHLKYTQRRLLAKNPVF